MKAETLKKGVWYYCDRLKTNVKYVGLQSYEESQYYNFWEPGLAMYYWLEPEEVEPMK